MEVTPIQSKPFLWGPVKSALIQDAKEQGPDTILRLCFTDEQRVKEMMVAVLTELGYDDIVLVDNALKSLFPVRKQPGTLKMVWRLVQKPTLSSDRSGQNAMKIAVEVAGNLGAPQTQWVLREAALHPDPTIRAVAVRHSYHLWERERELGYELLEHMAKNVMHGLVPDLAAFESVMGLSMVIFFDHTRDEQVRARLQQIWRGIIMRVLALQKGSRLGRATREFIREHVISFAMTIVLKTLRELPSYNPINSQTWKHSFAKDSLRRSYIGA